MQVKVFQQDHYLANFVQSTFDSLPSAKVKGVALIPQTQSNPMQRSDDRVLALIADCRDHLTIWILYMLNCVLI
jgi:phosphoglucomutase